jgi:hypothetical protein
MFKLVQGAEQKVGLAVIMSVPVRRTTVQNDQHQHDR